MRELREDKFNSKARCAVLKTQHDRSKLIDRLMEYASGILTATAVIDSMATTFQALAADEASAEINYACNQFCVYNRPTTISTHR